MPRLRATLPGTGVPWTKIPNRLLDVLMPGLKDTELRVLLALLRETSGWNREGKPATLSYRTLKARTGRHNEALTNALDSLEAKGLVHVARSARRRKPESGVPETGQQQTKTS